MRGCPSLLFLVMLAAAAAAPLFNSVAFGNQSDQTVKADAVPAAPLEPSSDETQTSVADRQSGRQGLHWIDGVIVAVYATCMLSLGWYYNRKQKNTDEYFVGNRAMNPFLIGVSLFATLFSTISYLSLPGELMAHGPVILAGALALPIYYFIVGYLIVPMYMRHRVTSAYELLETQLGVSVRLTGAVMFIVLRLSWMSLLIFFASSAMIEMLGLGQQITVGDLQVSSIAVVTFVTGCVAITYASLGGLRAVVITDLIQFLLLFGGAVLVVVTVTIQLDGFSWFPTQWVETWDPQPFFSTDPRQRLTVFGSILAGTLWWIFTAAGDQTAIQRFMATRDAKAARRSFLINSIAGAMVSIVLALVGFALLGFFQSNLELLPEGKTIRNHADHLFPHYIAYHLPIGLSGLVVSGLFAAAMSSLDSGVNSISAVVMTDFVDRFRNRPMSDKARVRTAQVLAFGIGLTVVVCASLFMEQVPGNFLEKTKRSIELFVAPIFLLFFMAFFVPFATSSGTIIAAVTGLAAAVVIGYWQPFTELHTAGLQWAALEPVTAAKASRHFKQLTGANTISFQWMLPVSLVTGLTCGCLASLLGRWISTNRTLNKSNRHS